MKCPKCNNRINIFQVRRQFRCKECNQLIRSNSDFVFFISFVTWFFFMGATYNLFDSLYWSIPLDGIFLLIILYLIFEKTDIIVFESIDESNKQTSNKNVKSQS